MGDAVLVTLFWAIGDFKAQRRWQAVVAILLALCVGAAVIQYRGFGYQPPPPITVGHARDDLRVYQFSQASPLGYQTTREIVASYS